MWSYLRKHDDVANSQNKQTVIKKRISNVNVYYIIPLNYQLTGHIILKLLFLFQQLTSKGTYF